MTIEELRQVEFEKYHRCYKQIGYRMGQNREAVAQETLKGMKVRGSLLDVGAGRGEMVAYAESIGFTPTMGVEIVDYLLTDKVIYGESHNLPFEDNSFDVVTSFDVFEHFLPEDTEISLKEINRVSKKAVMLCIALHASRSNNGENLHINLRKKKEWEKLIKQNIDGDVTLLETPYKPRSETWVVYKD